MTPPPINIDGRNENYSNVTIDGQDVTQITIDGQDVLSTIPDDGLTHVYSALDSASLSAGSWTDQNGSNDLSGSSVGYNSSAINSNGAMEFDQSQDHELSASAVPAGSGSAYTWHLVIAGPDDGSLEVLFLTGDRGSGWGAFLDGGTIKSDHSGQSATNIGAYTDPVVVSARYSSPDGLDALLNGADPGPGSQSLDPAPASGSLTMASQGGATFYDGFVGYLGLLDSRQSSSDFSDLHNSLVSAFDI